MLIRFAVAAMAVIFCSRNLKADSDCVMLSLNEVANRSYVDTPGVRGWTGDVQYRSLAGIPDGVHSYGGIPFHVANAARPGAKDFLWLAAERRAPDAPASAVLPVKADGALKQLALLHAAAWVVPGQKLGVIECLFADGHKQVFEVEAGRDVADWYGGGEGENVRYAYAEGEDKVCGNFISVFKLDAGRLEQISFRLDSPDGMWLISAVTLLKTPQPLPEREEQAPVLVPGSPAEAAPVNGGSSYRLIVLGDTHFDTDPEVYHSHYNEPDARLNAIQRAEFARNAAMWRQRCPRLVAAAAAHITPETRFVIQLGDLIQGDCGNAAVHRQMLDDTFSYFRQKFQNRPFLTVAGNHDVRGPGAFAAYQEVMPRLISRELRRNVGGTTFYFMQGEDLFLFIDFNAPDLKVIREAFEKHSGARYKFVVSHGAVIPADEEAVNWYAFGEMRRMRLQMRRLFLRNRVIVLTGHVHKFGLAEVKTAEGEITQLTLNSVWSNEQLAAPEKLFGSPADYGRQQQERFRNPEGAALLSEYRPALTRYWYADGAGYCVLDISPLGVSAQLFGGDAMTPACTVQLR